MHAIETLYQEHLARRQLPPRDLIERQTRRITDERLGRVIAGAPRLRPAQRRSARLSPPPPAGAPADGRRRHRLLAYCLLQAQGIETLATDLFAPQDNPRFRRPGWHPVQPMDALEALRRYPDHDVLGICLPPGLSLQQVYEAAPQATSRQLFVAGYCSRDAFGGGEEGIMSEMHGLRFRRVDCIPRWGLEAAGYRTVLIHIWHV